MNNLVIVESPAKAKTIEKILGKDFTVLSSYGHIRDLPKGNNAVDIEGGFVPRYEVSDDKKKVVDGLKKATKSADLVWLASDEDREGEAIAWHLYEALGLKEETTRRIVFHEITPKAIKNAVENPRPIDKNLVDAQQARRVLDRLVGFELSPLLWKKVKPQLSAGRVQSVTVKLIVEREREIMTFTPQEYWRVVGEFSDENSKSFKANLSRRLKSRKEAEDFLKALTGAEYIVDSIEKTPLKRYPSPPFTTSTLQQEASRKLGLSVAQTMSAAQKLYEAGLITYMRTDSVHLSSFAIESAKAEIENVFGAKYSKVRNFTTKSKGAQEAHEAIRPTYFDKQAAGSTRDEKRLYELIWKRAVASQMVEAELEKTTINIGVANNNERFVSTGEVVVFDGFLKLYMEGSDTEAGDDDSTEGLLPLLNVGQSVTMKQINAMQRNTQASPRYSEAMLVKKLEELGIGRPSTYAPTITTVINRGYVEKGSREGTKVEMGILTLNSAGAIISTQKTETVGSESKKLFPTDIGMIVTDYLQKAFENILDYSFTANVEKDFDEIAEGQVEWQKMLAGFYAPFHKTIEEASSNDDFVRSDREIGVDPKSGKMVIARVGRYGPMVQIGDVEDKKFAKLQSGQLIETITLEQALKLFALPRTVGEFEEKVVVIGIGPFGAYVRHDSKFTSLKKGVDDPLTITLERAVELIQEKREVEANRLIARFESLNAEVLRGRFGPYIASEGKNYKIPKTVDAESLTEEGCRELMATVTPTEPKRRGAAAKKPATKKPAAKKTTTKKTTTKK